MSRTKALFHTTVLSLMLLGAVQSVAVAGGDVSAADPTILPYLTPEVTRVLIEYNPRYSDPRICWKCFSI